MLKKYLRKGLSFFIKDPYLKCYYRFGSGWFGDFNSWEAAEALCTGYDDPSISIGVLRTVNQAKNEDGVYERDSSIIKGEPSFAFNSLKWIKQFSTEKEIRVVDFGGSLGSTYFQLKPFLEGYSLNWNVVEQEHVVSLGKSRLENDELKFFTDINDIPEINETFTFFSSAAIQYLNNPYKFLVDSNLIQFNQLIFDRLSVVENKSDRLSIQVVPKSVYRSVYPCWFLNKKKFLDFITELGFSLVDSFSALGGKVSTKSIPQSEYFSYVFKKK